MMRFLPIVAALLLAGCKFGPTVPERQLAPLPVAYSETTGTTGRPAAAVAAGTDRWWLAFRDPMLDHIIAAGIAGNLDIRQARARIAAAEAGVKAATSGFLPNLTLGASHEHSRESGSMKEVEGGVQTTAGQLGSVWILDLFGQVRAQVSTAEARREAAIAGDAVARLALISDLSSAYVDARYHQELLRIAERRLASSEQTAALTRRRLGEGVASELDVARAEAAVAVAAGEVPISEANFRRASNRASTLMGRPAGDLHPYLEQGRGQPRPAFVADAGVPADLVRNRPDVRVAEMEFEAAVAEIGVAWRDMFPTITLSGTITPSYIDTQAASGSLTKWVIGPALRLPIFEGGRLVANLRAAEARAVEREAAWRASVYKAVEDVENALVSLNRQEKALAAARRQVASAEKAMRLSQSAFREGVSSLLDTLDSERRYQEAVAAEALVKRNLALEFIALNVATGRGLPGPGTDAHATVIAAR